MLERTLVFVDTSYLLASFYNSWEIGARAQLEIDLPEVVATLGTMITQQLNQPVHRQYWYDGIPDSGPHRYQRSLRSCAGVQLRTGQLIEWGERRTQKGVDTRLVADLVLNATREQFSDFVLVSGDADMIPGVQEASDMGVRVHLYGFGWDSMSSALRHACDTTTIIDPREDFADSMQLQVLEGPLPPCIRERPLNDAEPVDQDNGPTPVPGLGPDPLRAPDEEEAEPEPSPAIVAKAARRQAEQDEPAQTEPAQAEPAQAECADDSERATDCDDEPTEAEVEATNQANKPGNQTLSNPEASDVPTPAPKPTPKPSMMAPRRKLRSRYVPLPEEVWSSAGFQTPYDVGQQYAAWWFENAATMEQRDKAHMLSGGGLPPEIDRPLLQFACETLHEYTLSETQRVNLRDGFHSGIRGVLINIRRD
ncbi:NYN domain-containing protein [Corynebacterium riegelii]|uniref:NYN domain-containing protein n=1 Tax=Corynebacterium riegelii TaxID=156976 RepID=UPI00254AA594|nr:NYN domain-containing protein [Corynebacterium riegelii]MDK7181080.1 NYN domain-containing protein [Corynebacterium riegelii]